MKLNRFIAMLNFEINNSELSLVVNPMNMKYSDWEISGF